MKNMKILIGCGILLFLFLVSIIIKIIFQIGYRKKFIDIFDDNMMDKLSNFNYDFLKIKRKIQLYTARVPNNPKEIPLEMEYNHGTFTSINANSIEVYGVKYKNEYLIYKINWSKENAKKIKDIVNDTNLKLSNNMSMNN
jgi:hypothetical protein